MQLTVPIPNLKNGQTRLNLSTGQRLPDDELFFEVRLGVDPSGLQDLEEAPRSPGLQVPDGEHEAPSGKEGVRWRE